MRLNSINILVRSVRVLREPPRSSIMAIIVSITSTTRPTSPVLQNFLVAQRQSGSTLHPDTTEDITHLRLHRTNIIMRGS
jgi:hypothetical protein